MRRRSSRCTSPKRSVSRGWSHGWCTTASARRCPPACDPRTVSRGTRCTRLEAITSICSWSTSLRSGLVTLIGQLADRNKPATSTADVPVWLMERKSLVASTLCNRFGEFQLEYAPARNLRLHVPLPAAGKRLEVSTGSPDARTASRPRPREDRPPADQSAGHRRVKRRLDATKRWRRWRQAGRPAPSLQLRLAGGSPTVASHPAIIFCQLAAVLG